VFFSVLALNTLARPNWVREWTFFSQYRGSVRRLDGGESPKFEPSFDGIDFDALRRPDPILWHESVNLFVDELEDNGMSHFSVKTVRHRSLLTACKLLPLSATLSQRVMPDSAYLLARHSLRVDDVIVRVYDTRIWVRFDTEPPIAIREVTMREATWARLAEEGLPTDCAAYINPDAFAATLPLVVVTKECLSFV
jgi:type 2A phosphatase activator TIP41